MEAFSDEAQTWAATATPGELALALDLGIRCVRAVGSALPAVDRGAKGEDEVYALLRQTYGGRLRDVARSAQRGDFELETRAGPLLIEVKNYSGTVPGAEVEKFIRDLRSRDAPAGVFLSLASPIAGKRAAVELVLEPQVSGGSLVPAVFAAARAGGLLHRDIALAAVEMAICLAEAYPRGTRGLHRDSVLTYAVAAEQIATSAASLRADLSRHASDSVSAAAKLGDRLGELGREARDLARAQRSEAEVIVDVGPEGVVVDMLARYPQATSAANLAALVAALPASPWNLLKTKAVHIASGCSISFLKRSTDAQIPSVRADVNVIATLVAGYPEKVSLGGGVLALEVDDVTLGDAVRLFQH